MIELTKEESMLLLAIKGHKIAGWEKGKYEESYDYAKRVSGAICGCMPDHKHWYYELFLKVCEDHVKERTYREIIIPGMFNHEHNPNKKIYMALRLCRCDHLKIDMSVIEGFVDPEEIMG